MQGDHSHPGSQYPHHWQPHHQIYSRGLHSLLRQQEVGTTPLMMAKTVVRAILEVTLQELHCPSGVRFLATHFYCTASSTSEPASHLLCQSTSTVVWGFVLHQLLQTRPITLTCMIGTLKLLNVPSPTNLLYQTPCTSSSCTLPYFGKSAAGCITRVVHVSSSVVPTFSSQVPAKTQFSRRQRSVLMRGWL